MEGWGERWQDEGWEGQTLQGNGITTGLLTDYCSYIQAHARGNQQNEACHCVCECKL